MGIEPTYPSEKYGYIKPQKNEDGTDGWGFTEKPNAEKAQEYIDGGALWNGGVFAYKLSYVLDKSKKLLGADDYDELFSNYANLKKISFDYAVVESETSIDVLRYNGEWKDLGTWNTLTEAMEDPIIVTFFRHRLMMHQASAITITTRIRYLMVSKISFFLFSFFASSSKRRFICSLHEDSDKHPA